MNRHTLMILSLVVLNSCSPNEIDFKSVVPLTERVQPSEMPEKVPMEELSDSDILTEPTVPDSINLDVPFFPQAPDGNWDLPWQEACEEASIILAVFYAENNSLDKNRFTEEILNLVEYQKKEFGDYKHSSVDMTVQMIQDYFEYQKITILENPTDEEMKKKLADGHVIVAPFAGRMLKNPFYLGEGPLYHMLVIKGYDSEHFITNDVGTKRGENFIYPIQTVMNALHDWDEKDMAKGKKRVIVF